MIGDSSDWGLSQTPGQISLEVPELPVLLAVGIFLFLFERGVIRITSKYFFFLQLNLSKGSYTALPLPPLTYAAHGYYCDYTKVQISVVDCFIINMKASWNNGLPRVICLQTFQFFQLVSYLVLSTLNMWKLVIHIPAALKKLNDVPNIPFRVSVFCRCLASVTLAIKMQAKWSHEDGHRLDTSTEVFHIYPRVCSH